MAIRVNVDDFYNYSHKLPAHAGDLEKAGAKLRETCRGATALNVWTGPSAKAFEAYIDPIEDRYDKAVDGVVEYGNRLCQVAKVYVGLRDRLREIVGSK